MKKQAEEYLKQALADNNAQFRDNQWECIQAILEKRRVLAVQRTGWGKSMLYFIASKLLRLQANGLTLVISPLLALMRNQLEAAQRLGLAARTLNSSNTAQWDSITSEILADRVDLLFISPERLANEQFREEILGSIAGNIALFVIDEAHCISDWGHDFRPDYRLISRVLRLLPPNIPVLATTATANDRVIRDIQSQLGDNLLIQRGDLNRKSLRLQNIFMPAYSARLAWLAKTIPSLPGSGIIYVLTRRDAEIVALWLQSRGISAKAYHSDLQKIENDSSAREFLEQELISNKIKVLVATVALGMGFDKPDLGFVIHFQRPASVVHYYQQVGRAGRAIKNAHGILLCGSEDDSIAEFFMENAFPAQAHVTKILSCLQNNEGLSIKELEEKINLKRSVIEKALKFLLIESPAPVAKLSSKWFATPIASSWTLDQSYIDSITNIRIAEQREMQRYMETKDCLMRFLQNALDDPFSKDCARCANCVPGTAIDAAYPPELEKSAIKFLKNSYEKITPRKMWPAKDIFEKYPFAGSKIPDDLMANEGRALCRWRDSSWGEVVADNKYKTGYFSDELVMACARLFKKWAPAPSPEWVACVPSLTRLSLVPDFTSRLAKALNLPFIDCIRKIKQNQEQKNMENSWQQAKNLDGVFSIEKSLMQTGPCLLIDDMVDSGWTITVLSALLRLNGCTAVYPLALAINS